jgi:hypothetical protein
MRMYVRIRTKDRFEITSVQPSTRKVAAPVNKSAFVVTNQAEFNQLR